MSLPFSYIQEIHSKIIEKKKKMVRFRTWNVIIPIPSRSELKQITPFQYLWWSTNEYKQFQQDANNDLKMIVQRHPFITLPDALQLLYQSDISFSKNFY